MSGPLLSFACSAPVRWVGAPGSWPAGQQRGFQLLGMPCGYWAGWEGAREREASWELIPAGPRCLLRELALTRASCPLDTPLSLSPPALPPTAPFTWGPSLHPLSPRPLYVLSVPFPGPRVRLRWRPRRVWPLGTDWPVAGLARWREQETDFKNHPHTGSYFAILYEADFPDPGRFHLH